MKLYEIAGQYTEALSSLSEMVEAGDMPKEVMSDTLEALSGELEEKAKNVGAWIKNLEIDAKALKDAEAAFAARRKSIQSKLDWAKEYLHHNMEASGITEIDCTLYSLKIQKNPKAVSITGDVPKEYMTIKTTEAPDKKAIKALIESDECDFAELTQSTRLVIK